MNKESEPKPPTRKSLVSDYARGHLIGTLFGKYSRAWGREEEIAEAIALAHNDGDINILSIVTNEALEAVKRHDFFSGQNLYCKLIPRLRAETEEMVEAVDCLIRAAGNDMAGGLPGNALAEWCEKDQARSADLLSLVKAGNGIARAFIPLAVRNATPDVRDELIGELHAAANGADEASRRNAIFGLGQIDPSTDDEWVKLTQTLQSGAEASDDQVRSATLAAAARRLRSGAGANADGMEGVIKRVLEPVFGPQLLHQCADSLWLDGEHFSESLRGQMLEALLEVDPANLGTLDHLDHALANLVRHGTAETAADFLSALLLRHHGNLDLKPFGSTCHAVREQPEIVLEDWVVNWLLDGRFALCESLSGGLFEGQMNERALDIDFARYALKPDDYAYLARKAIGYLFLQPLTVASIIVSLVRSAPKDKRQELEDLLFDPMLLNYGGFAKDYLEPVAKQKGDRARKTAANALVRIKAYLADLNAARSIIELEPSERQRQMEWQRHSDTMAEAYRLADQKSVFANLFTKVVVLYGNRSVSYVRHHKEDTRRIETKMHSHGVSFEMPRIEIVDPTGLHKLLLSFRSEGRPA